MFDTVKDYAYSVYCLNPHLIFSYSKERVKETVVVYTSKSELDALLIEATSNENWNISNSKLQ